MALVSTLSERPAARLFSLCAGLIALLVLLSAEAQVRQPLPGLPENLPDPRELRIPPLPLGTPKAEPPPDWMVWRSFHDSVQFYQRESPAMVHGLLNSVGLSAAEANVVLTAGFAYLEELELIGAQFRADVSRRFTTAEHRRVLASIGWPIDQPDPIPALTPDGRPIKEALAAEGSLARLEEMRNSAFRAHWESLAESIGLYKLIRVELYIEKEVAPNVHVATRAKLVSPAPHPVPKDRIDRIIRR